MTGIFICCTSKWHGVPDSPNSEKENTSMQGRDNGLEINQFDNTGGPTGNKKSNTASFDSIVKT